MYWARELVEQIRVLNAKIGELLEARDPAALDECERVMRRAIERAEEATAAFEAHGRSHQLHPRSVESLARMREILDELWFNTD
jgi:hypothetical protein